MCALLLEAKDDSDAELERILKLSDLTEEKSDSRDRNYEIELG